MAILRKSTFAALFAGVLVAHATNDAGAQTKWRPSKSVELIVPTAPGGANDQVARAIQTVVRDQKLVSTPVEVMNKPGGNQSIAVAYLNQHPADPHYLLIANPTLIGSHIAGISSFNYTDLTPIALLMSEHTVFSVPADSPIQTVHDFFSRLKADPESLAIGVVSRGGPSHLSLSAAVRAAGIDARKLKTVIFKTNPESLTAMVGGHIDAVASSVSAALGHFRSGKTRLLAVVAPQRMSGALAQVPTLREQGIDVTQASWRVVFAPKGIAAAELAYWEDVLAKVAASDGWKQTLEKNSWSSPFLRGKELADYLEGNYKLTRAVMKDLGMAK
ncbi:MAG: tripartite tricarboxylate transporter substrate binding protein [Burkholderiales bacterium]